MKTWWLVLWLGVLSVVHAQGLQEGGPTPDGAARAAAERSLETLAALVNEGNAKSLGFDSPRDTAGATLGEPLAVYLVRLDELRAYSRAADPASLLKPLPRVIYPVLVAGRTRALITLEAKDGSWQAVSFGLPALAQYLARTQAARPIAAPALVQVPALGMQLLAHREAGRLLVTPLIDEPGLGWSAGRALPAEDAFAALVAPARAYNGLPD